MANSPDGNSTRRFSDRVANYVRYRPSYPREVIDWLLEQTGLEGGARVADIGSGTGIFSELWLERGFRVDAVEPNDEMRQAAESRLGQWAGFTSVSAAAEDTALADHSVDLVVAAQAFHWFDVPRFAIESSRILKPGGKVALIWNERRLAGNAFTEGYEALLRTYGTDYEKVSHRRLAVSDFESFFSGAYESFVTAYVQRFDLAGLRGRVLSSSYSPAPGHADHAPMMAALEALFDRTATDNLVEFPYDTQVYLGDVETGGVETGGVETGGVKAGRMTAGGCKTDD